MSAAVDDAWQAALGAEHQAVFGYALLGPQLDGSDQALAVSCSNAHETLRDDVEAAQVKAGLEPVQTEADYPSLYPVSDAKAARLLAARLEDDCAAAWRFLYAAAAAAAGTGARSLRSAAQTGLTASAVRAARWRTLIDPARATVAFPGI